MNTRDLDDAVLLFPFIAEDVENIRGEPGKLSPSANRILNAVKGIMQGHDQIKRELAIILCKAGAAPSEAFKLQQQIDSMEHSTDTQKAQLELERKIRTLQEAQRRIHKLSEQCVQNLIEERHAIKTLVEFLDRMFPLRELNTDNPPGMVTDFHASVWPVPGTKDMADHVPMYFDRSTMVNPLPDPSGMIKFTHDLVVKRWQQMKDQQGLNAYLR